MLSLNKRNPSIAYIALSSPQIFASISDRLSGCPVSNSSIRVHLFMYILVPSPAPKISRVDHLAICLPVVLLARGNEAVFHPRTLCRNERTSCRPPDVLTFGRTTRFMYVHSEQELPQH